MNNIAIDFLINDILIEDSTDDIGAQLEYFTPPATMISNIMQAVAALPQPKPLSQWSGFEFFQPECEAMPLS